MCRPFFGALVEYMISGPVIAMVWEGKGVVLTGRKIIGAAQLRTLGPAVFPSYKALLDDNPMLSSPPGVCTTTRVHHHGMAALDHRTEPSDDVQELPTLLRPSQALSAETTALRWVATSSTAQMLLSQRRRRLLYGSLKVRPFAFRRSWHANQAIAHH